jgi:hypothetical protein
MGRQREILPPKTQVPQPKTPPCQRVPHAPNPENVTVFLCLLLNPALARCG